MKLKIKTYWILPNSNRISKEVVRIKKGTFQCNNIILEMSNLSKI